NGTAARIEHLVEGDAVEALLADGELCDQAGNGSAHAGGGPAAPRAAERDLARFDFDEVQPHEQASGEKDLAGRRIEAHRGKLDLRLLRLSLEAGAEHAGEAAGEQPAAEARGLLSRGACGTDDAAVGDVDGGKAGGRGPEAPEGEGREGPHARGGGPGPGRGARPGLAGRH